MTAEYSTHRTITSELAGKMIAAASHKATELGVPMCIAIVDEAGNLKAFLRMDGAHLLGMGVAQDKAWSAVAWDMPTGEWYDFIKDDPILTIGVPRIPRLTILGGGFPIKVDGVTIGGIGVSGGHYTQDIECAKAALAVLDSLRQGA